MIDDIKIALELAEMELKAMYERNGYTGSNVLSQVQKAQELVKESDSLPPVSARTEMRKQAITVFELTKGFTGEPTDNAMKTALEMADYVMRLTNNL